MYTNSIEEIVQSGFRTYDKRYLLKTLGVKGDRKSYTTHIVNIKGKNDGILTTTNQKIKNLNGRK